MANARALYSEEAVGYGHPTKADVINRFGMVAHQEDGTHWKKIGTLTRDCTQAGADVPYTGVGFRPTHIIFLSAMVGTDFEHSVGFDDGTNHYCIAGITAARWDPEMNLSIYGQEGAGIDTMGIIKTFDADGFTITWSKTGAPNGSLVVFYLALK